MNQAGTPDSRAKLIAGASLQPLVIEFGSGRRESIRPTVLKAVLLAVWNHEGQLVPIQKIADETGCGLSTAYRAIRCMTRDGLIVEIIAGNNQSASSYAVSDKRLLEYQCPLAA